MFWIIIAVGVCLVTLFTLLHFRTAKQMEQDMALILAECGKLQQSAMPSRKP